MKPFLDDNFLLNNPTAERLYHDFAKDMPIFDYHNHLVPQEIADDVHFGTLFDIWLAGDHYKWRAMRTNGIPERLVTGDAAPREKFQAWAETVPKTLRNPLYHWTHLELRRYFGIETLLGPDTAEEIWNETKDQLAKPEFSTRNLLTRMKVRGVCTTDDPADDLAWHTKAADTECPLKVLPTFRPDKALTIRDTVNWNLWIDQLAKAVGHKIKNWDDLKDALAARHDYFADIGCRLSDHGLQAPFASKWTNKQVKVAFKDARSGEKVSRKDADAFCTAVMQYVGKLNAAKGWVMQLHIGALRNNNSRWFETLGRDCGGDSIGDDQIAPKLSAFLDSLDQTNELPKTVLYNLNPRDNALMATMIGNFQDGSVPGKMQFGASWWFLDQKFGIEQQFNDLSALGLLPRFIGMLTDSRSLLSFPRHEYFRRILCDLLGRDMENGELPHDIDMLGAMVQDICYNNVVDYIGVDA